MVPFPCFKLYIQTTSHQISLDKNKKKDIQLIKLRTDKGLRNLHALSVKQCTLLVASLLVVCQL